METFRFSARVSMWRDVVVSMILLFSSSILQVSWAQAGPSNILLNIACGSNQSYTDPITGLTWVPDTPYITTGKTKTSLGSAPASPPNASGMGSLRYFDDPQPKNCYSLLVNISSHPYKFYMIRASFFYGNYDQNAQPPSFQLAMDGNIVANITMADSISGQYVEFQYVLLYSNTLFLCLVRTSPLSTPFISGITLVQVTDYFTDFSRVFSRNSLLSGYIMKTVTRVNFGGTDLVRYPSDSHDYMWHPQGANSALLNLTTTPIEALSTTNTIQFLDIPSTVFQTVVTTFGESLTSYFLPQGSWEVGWPNIDLLSQNQYLSLYWAELNSSTSNMTREFNLTLPAYPNWAGLSSLNGSYFSTSGYFIWDTNFTTSGLNDTFILTNTNSSASSTLGPIVNGMELYSESAPRVLKTSEEDALAIEIIKSSLGLTEWTDDPCVPVPHSWLSCATSNDIDLGPNIIALNLSGYNLEGTISQISMDPLNLSSFISLSLDNNELIGILPDWSSMTSLITLNLANNNLSGTLPGWLTSFKNLRYLNVENNNFSGPIPTTLLSSNTLIFQYYPGNPLLTGGVDVNGNSTTSSSRAKRTILGATVGSVLGVLLVSAVAFYLYPLLKPKLSKLHKGNTSEIASGANSYTLAEVSAMIRNFNTQIGKGGFGPVYYGKLPNGQEVAVKVADGSTGQGQREFFNEVDILSRVRHKNLVALVGHCQENNQQILVYEYMKNGSVHDQLFGNTVSTGLLDWKMRLQIALNAAQDLEYLHSWCSSSFIHRDIKSSNILLSEKFDAKVADFGLTKLMGEAKDTRVLTMVMGTAGYLDPEYYHTQYLSTKSDVYSFGVVLLELITGRRAIDRSSESNINLCDWVQESLEEGNMEAILDPGVKASMPTPNHDGLSKVVEIALQCVEPKSVNRPTMTTVLEQLCQATILEDPGASVEMSYGPFDYSGSETAPIAR